ncbi:MAG: hypothetical protein ACI8RE_002390 [Ilumatobacter sp.]
MLTLAAQGSFGAAGFLCVVASAVVVGSAAARARKLALPGASEPTVVTIEPNRVLDTRYDVGLTGQVVAGAARLVTITWIVDTCLDATSTTAAKQVVLADVTVALLNVTAAPPTAAGFLSIRPGTATDVAAIARLNFQADDARRFRSPSLPRCHDRNKRWSDRPPQRNANTRSSPACDCRHRRLHHLHRPGRPHQPRRPRLAVSTQHARVRTVRQLRRLARSASTQALPLASTSQRSLSRQAHLQAMASP